MCYISFSLVFSIYWLRLSGMLFFLKYKMITFDTLSVNQFLRNVTFYILETYEINYEQICQCMLAMNSNVQHENKI